MPGQAGKNHIVMLTRALQSWSAAEEKPSWSLCQAWSSLLVVCWDGCGMVPPKAPLEWGCLQDSLSGLELKQNTLELPVPFLETC